MHDLLDVWPFLVSLIAYANIYLFVGGWCTKLGPVSTAEESMRSSTRNGATGPTIGQLVSF